MRINRTKNDYSAIIEISPYDDGRPDLITVRKSKGYERSGKWQPATVNWSALGNVSPKRAEQFTVALQYAVGQAMELDAEYEV